jgi:FtsP/CotA-like multicopper oxidase with cupredoxin domain
VLPNRGAIVNTADIDRNGAIAMYPTLVSYRRPTAGVLKDVVMVGAFQEVEVDFTATSRGLSLFHCHMQSHMDFGFMALFHCA